MPFGEGDGEAVALGRCSMPSSERATERLPCSSVLYAAAATGSLDACMGGKCSGRYYAESAEAWTDKERVLRLRVQSASMAGHASKVTVRLRPEGSLHDSSQVWKRGVLVTSAGLLLSMVVGGSQPR